MLFLVIPVKTGIQNPSGKILDSCFRRNDDLKNPPFWKGFQKAKVIRIFHFSMKLSVFF